MRGGQGLLLAGGAVFRALLPRLLRAGRCRRLGRRGRKRRQQLLLLVLLLLLQSVEDQRATGKLEQIQGPETRRAFYTKRDTWVRSGLCCPGQRTGQQAAQVESGRGDGAGVPAQHGARAAPQSRDSAHRAHHVDEAKSSRGGHGRGGAGPWGDGCHHGGERNGRYRRCLAQRPLLLSKPS